MFTFTLLSNTLGEVPKIFVLLKKIISFHKKYYYLYLSWDNCLPIYIIYKKSLNIILFNLV